MPNGYAIDVLNYFFKATGIDVQYVNGMSWKRLAKMFVNDELDVLQPVYYDPSRALLADLTEPFLDTPFGVITKKGNQVSHIDALKNKRVAIPDGWILATHLKQYFPDIEIVHVPTVKAMFERVRQGEVDAAIDTTPILHHVAKQYFIDDLVVSSPLEFGDVKLPQQLHFMINKTKPELVDVFNTVINHLDKHYKPVLLKKWLSRTDESITHLGLVPYRALLQLAQQGGTDGLIQTEMAGQNSYAYVVPFKGVYEQKEFLAIVSPVNEVMAAGLEKVKRSIVITVIALGFLLPIVWLLADFLFKPIRQLAENSKHIAYRRYDQVEQVESNIVELNDLANSMDNMSASIQEHEAAQQALLDSFIKVIAQAIDDKSPHTAGHCERVPELAFMLVEQANQAEFGIFEQFKMDSECRWREFQVAAWLHDCGKITTPEHIIDKGTKLEAIYNRIHEIRMRFEVLWRDAEIDYLTACSEAGADLDKLLAAKQLRQQQLQDDFAFIANANIGGEFMSGEDVERLKQLAQIPWQRYFDNTLGLSHIELDRHQTKPVPLPATEQLLSDKAEHIIERVRGTEYPPEFGIKMEIPEHLYNMGELYNLSIKAGTLTSEDRFKINEHIIATIKMLENLPFPDELKNVPRYASTHHETTIGTGYPRKLKGDELSVPERVMVLADVYEALTASDRPYKKAKPISEAVDILYKMMQRGHVDQDVFELFIRSGVYLDYARNFLPESQIDEVDISQYISEQ
jgi:HD-GYP domain-containing protein (c-di-GMP phosphodiesterase class II)/ABC-type amino acid transport substrate-binding protein